MSLTFNQKLYQAERKIKNIQKNYQKMVDDYVDIFKKEMNKICYNAISDFYDSYEPHIYHRKHSIYDAFNVDVDKNGYKISFDSDYMSEYSHRVSNDYIFNIAFEEGWHGGAPKSSMNQLYYRRPVPEYTEWGRRAKRSVAPYKVIVDRANERINSLKKEVNKEFDRVVRSPLAEIANMFKEG